MFHFLFSRNMCIFHVFLRKDWDDPIMKNMLADSLISNNPRPSPFWKITLVVNRCNFKDSLGLQCIRSYAPPKLAVCILKIGCLAGCRIRFQKIVDAQTCPSVGIMNTYCTYFKICCRLNNNVSKKRRNEANIGILPLIFNEANERGIASP